MFTIGKTEQNFQLNIHQEETGGKLSQIAS